MSRSSRVSTRLVQAVDQQPAALLAVFSVLLLGTCVARASAKAFTHDEIITLIVSGLPTIRVMWRAHLDAADLAPPLNSIATHLVAAVFGVGRISARLPALAGYWLMTMVVFEVVRRRSNAVVGLSAAILPSFTGAAAYAYEARPYGLSFGLFALALFCWSEAAKGRARVIHLPLLALALGGGVWAHYYALFAFVPIVVGEMVRTARNRQFDWRMNAAVAAALLATVPLVSLARAASTRAAGYWARSHGLVADAGDAYRFLAGPAIGRRALVLVSLVLITAFVARRRGRKFCSDVDAVPAHEIAAGVAIVLIPLGGAILGVFTQVFLPRYVLLSVVGLAIVAPLLAWRLSPSRVTDLVLCVGLASAFTYTSVETLVAPPHFRNPLELRPLLTRQLAGTSPVVVTDTLFLESWYYTLPDGGRQLKYLADPAAALRRSDSDTADRNYLALRDWAPMAVDRWDTFVAGHRAFRMYAAGPHHWQLARVREGGGSLREIGHEMGYWLYDVELPGPDREVADSSR